MERLPLLLFKAPLYVVKQNFSNLLLVLKGDAPLCIWFKIAKRFISLFHSTLKYSCEADSQTTY